MNINIITIESRYAALLAEQSEIDNAIKAARKARKVETTEYAKLVLRRSEIETRIARISKVRGVRNSIKSRFVTVATSTKDSVVALPSNTKNAVVGSYTDWTLVVMTKLTHRAILAEYAEELQAFETIEGYYMDLDKVTVRDRVSSVKSRIDDIRSSRQADKAALSFYAQH